MENEIRTDNEIFSFHIKTFHHYWRSQQSPCSPSNFYIFQATKIHFGMHVRNVSDAWNSSTARGSSGSSEEDQEEEDEELVCRS